MKDLLTRLNKTIDELLLIKKDLEQQNRVMLKEEKIRQERTKRKNVKSDFEKNYIERKS